VIAIDQRRKRNGRALEFLGTYNPISEPVEIKLKTERIDAWVAEGAQLSDAVKALVRRLKAQPQPVEVAEPAPAATPQAPAPAPAEGN
jgi:small subunit ribosomal protein S16